MRLDTVAKGCHQREAAEMERRNFREKNVGGKIDRVCDDWDTKNRAGKGTSYKKTDFWQDMQTLDVILTVYNLG